MKGARFKSAMRAVLRHLGEALMWVGVTFGMDGSVAAEISTRARRRAGQAAMLDNAGEHADQLSMTPLSRAERAEWATLVERLR